MTAAEVLGDYAASYWLKRAVREAIDRDPVDALNDAEALVSVLLDRLERIHAGQLPQGQVSR